MLSVYIILPVTALSFIRPLVVSSIVTSVVVSRPIPIVGPVIISTVVVVSPISTPIPTEGSIAGLKSLLSVSTLASRSTLVNSRLVRGLSFVHFHIHFADKQCQFIYAVTVPLQSFHSIKSQSPFAYSVRGLVTVIHLHKCSGR